MRALGKKKLKRISKPNKNRELLLNTPITDRQDTKKEFLSQLSKFKLQRKAMKQGASYLVAILQTS